MARDIATDDRGHYRPRCQARALQFRYGHVGAAMATAMTEAFILGYLLVRVPRDLLSVGSIAVFAKAATA